MPRLQRFDFGSSAYERPNQRWVCGRAATGEACRLGPDSKGRCCVVAECQPRRDGDRWVCTRTNAAGGACECGPMADGTCSRPIPPCVPVRSMRARRGLTVRWAVAATIGFLAVVLGVGGGAMLMPGPLSQAHSSLGNCRDCHSAVADGPFGWVHAAFTASDGARDSGKCLQCHMVGKDALKPHGVATAELAAITKRIAARPRPSPPLPATLRKVLFPVEAGVQAGLPCATCHVEHHGAKFDLAAVGDTPCQSCHAVQFASLSAGHPEFDHYPYQRRTRLIFDHAAHFARHFPEIAAKQDAAMKPPTACVDCHQPGPNGRQMATKPFDGTCGACHLGQIVGTDRAIGPRGVAMLSVPGLDIPMLRQHGIGIGNWPDNSDARLTPIMSLLLAADPDGKAALAATAKLDLQDLRQATDAELKAVGDLAWAIKKLFFEMSTVGAAKFRDRLIAATGRKPDDVMADRLVASLPRDVLLGAQRDWLPELSAELADHAAGKPVPIPGGPPPAAAAKPAGTTGPKHTGDILGPKDQGDILNDDAKSAAPDATKDQGDILGPKDQGDILSGDTKPAAKDQGDILGGKDQGDILTGAPPATPPADSSMTASAAPAKQQTVDEERFARLGGWYRQNNQVLFYPTGHADRFLRAWLDFAGSIYGTPGQALAEPVFAQLSRKDAQGQCTKCHSVERAADGALMLKWHPKEPVAAPHGFTRFTHAPHLRVATDKGCLTCHQLDPAAKYIDAFTQPDPHRFASNFKPMERTVCATCHTPQAAGDSCLTCHGYHVNPIETPIMGTRISATLPAPATRK